MSLRLLSLSLCLFSFLFSQGDKIRKSQLSTIKQQIAHTSVEVEYSRPNINGRDIFGKLVPYGEIWRTGANFCTTITTTKELHIDGKALPTGKYAIYTIPDKDKWIVILNKKMSWGTKYEASEDVFRFQVKPKLMREKTETFTAQFENVNTYTAELALQWEFTKIIIPIQTH